MDVKDALAKLAPLPLVITEDELRHARDMINEESSTRQIMRREILSRFRETARAMAYDTGIDDLEFQMVMSRLGFQDIRALCQVELEENKEG